MNQTKLIYRMSVTIKTVCRKWYFLTQGILPRVNDSIRKKSIKNSYCSRMYREDTNITEKL